MAAQGRQRQAIITQKARLEVPSVQTDASSLKRSRLPRLLRFAVGIALLLFPFAGLATRQQPEEADYATARYAGTPSDTITRLQTCIDKGQVTLAHDADRGYLPAVLKALHIPVSSQVLVFSKTSVQKELISPQNPRALYFNDETYIGYVPGSPTLEVASMDPKLGTVYYVLLQRQKEKPRFFRNIRPCMECHGARNADHLPVHLMRSVYPDVEGNPVEGAADYRTTDSSAFAERWGGWYVTGTHGSQRHMGNRIAEKHGDTVTIDREKGANITDLRPTLDTSAYLSPHSDIVALLVLAHQTHIQNLITKVNYAVGRPLTAGIAPPAKGNREAELSEAAKAACEELLRAMLFVGEARLADPIVGTSGFAAEFAAGGPRDHRNRSLREFDLKRRLFRHPCSYMIYTPAFDSLPRPARDFIYRRLGEVLLGQDHSSDFASLSGADRRSIGEILHETKPDFAATIARGMLSHPRK